MHVDEVVTAMSAKAQLQASAASSSASAESAALEDRWRALHAESLATLRQVVSQPSSRSHGGGASLESAFLAALPAVALDGLREAEALAREEHGATVVQLYELVAAHEALLEEMYAVLREARAGVAMLSPESAADRGVHGLGLSPADRCAALATVLRAYEADLQMKQAAARRVGDGGAPAAEMQALLVAWELQPMLEPADAMRAGLEAQEALELSRRV